MSPPGLSMTNLQQRVRTSDKRVLSVSLYPFFIPGPLLKPNVKHTVTHVALATYTKLPSLNADDLLLVPALRELGVTAVPAVWDSPDVCWEEFQGVVVRSCWDYHHRREEFLAWV